MFVGSQEPDRRKVHRMTKLELMLALMEIEGCDVSRLHVEYGKRAVKCPWHDDRTPSAVLYATGNFKCYACGIFGDAWDILHHVRGLSFPDAESWLRIHGIYADRPGTLGKPKLAEKEPEEEKWRRSLFD
jgi:hypothetical protein